MRKKTTIATAPKFKETDFERKSRERKEAQAIAEKFKNIKPTKYLLK